MVDHVIEGYSRCAEEITALQRSRACPGFGLGRENPGFGANIEITIRAVHHPKLNLTGNGSLRVTHAPQRNGQRAKVDILLVPI